MYSSEEEDEGMSWLELIVSVRNNTYGYKLKYVAQDVNEPHASYGFYGNNIFDGFKEEIDQLVESDRSAFVKEVIQPVTQTDSQQFS
eukprot:gene5500-161_t